MLARLSLHTTRLFDLRLETPDSSTSREDDETFVVDVDAFRSLLRPLPNITWQGVTGICGKTITPVYKSIQNMLNEDAECVARLFSELEPLQEDDSAGAESNENDVLPLGCTNASLGCSDNDTFCDSLPDERPHRKRRRSLSPRNTLLMIPSTHPSTPTIVVTPCPPCPHETSCCVPYQDDYFGARLTVPSHPVFNKVFPPLAPIVNSPPGVRAWRWTRGHWIADLPTLDEQVRRGMFSRVQAVKRRARRAVKPP